MDNKILITGYRRPDLDATACAVAYSEFLNTRGEDTVAGLIGKPHREAQFVLEKTDKEPEDGDDFIGEVEKIILVDASDLRGLDDRIDPEKVIELIDHREEHHADDFPNARSQVEMVGAAATLIGEKFRESDISISEDSALLIYAAILSNTMNFKANVTKERDRKIAEWLEEKIDVEEGFVHEMFEHRSEFVENLEEAFLDEFATETFEGKDLGVIQFEIIDVEEFLREKKQECLRYLEKFKDERELDHIMLTCADLEEGFNKFLTPDSETKQIISEALDVKFKDGEAKRENVLLRKEIIPKLRDQITRG